MAGAVLVEELLQRRRVRPQFADVALELVEAGVDAAALLAREFERLSQQFDVLARDVPLSDLLGEFTSERLPSDRLVVGRFDARGLVLGLVVGVVRLGVRFLRCCVRVGFRLRFRLGLGLGLGLPAAAVASFDPSSCGSFRLSVSISSSSSSPGTLSLSPEMTSRTTSLPDCPTTAAGSAASSSSGGATVASSGSVRNFSTLSVPVARIP
ncbi:hypothetical protein VB773_09220 [Haloarculaceae archaeon H-GB2-1]|nr:hypothetical protein [Haloarculaceae archaeon H-GB11]MEA5407730.1 hypothetical protein [Haloarculaceae archaeon H-GB2-1]